jgi:hypothetical protein
MDTATVAEVYSWHHALLALSAAFTFGWLRDLEEGSARPPVNDERRAALWGLLAGAAVTMHATAVFFIVPLSMALVAALAKAGRWRVLLVLVAMATSLAPLGSYGWILWRASHPAAFQWPVGPSVTALWMHARGAAYSHFLGGFAPSTAEWAFIRGALLPWILPGITLGTVLSLRVPSRAVRWGLLSLLTGAVCQIVFVVSYGVPDPEAYFVPALMVSVMASTLAIAWLGARKGARVAWTIGLALALVSAVGSVPRAFRLRDELSRADAEFRIAWRSIPGAHGIVLWADDHYHRFVLLQLLEHQRPGLYVDNPEMLVWPARRRAFRARFGFDPLEGLELRTAADLASIPVNIERRTRIPVTVLAQSRDR